MAGAQVAVAMPRHKSISDEELLDRALPVIGRAGPAGFTLADVAREVGVSPATLLQRFGDKQTLIERVFSRDNERFVDWIGNLPAEGGVDAALDASPESGPPDSGETNAGPCSRTRFSCPRCDARSMQMEAARTLQAARSRTSACRMHGQESGVATSVPPPTRPAITTGPCAQSWPWPIARISMSTLRPPGN